MGLTKRERDLYYKIFHTGIAGECRFIENINNAEGGIKVKDNVTQKEYIISITKCKQKHNLKGGLYEEEIKIVMNALAGYPTVTTSEFADKVEKILRGYKEENKDEEIH